MPGQPDALRQLSAVQESLRPLGSSLSDVECCLSGLGHGPVSLKHCFQLAIATDALVRDHGVPEGWAWETRTGKRWGSHLWDHDRRRAFSCRFDFATRYLDFYKKWPLFLAGVSESTDVTTLGFAMKRVPSGLAGQKIGRLRIAEPAELASLVEAKVRTHLRPEVTRPKKELVEGTLQRSVAYTTWLKREAWGQYLPGSNEIWIDRRLVNLLLWHLHSGPSPLPDERGSILERTLTHELVHVAQHRSGTNLTAEHNEVLAHYARHRPELPPDKVREASEWVSKHYLPEFALMEEMAVLAEDESLRDHSAFAHLMGP